jgi:hypothetical protein
MPDDCQENNQKPQSVWNNLFICKKYSIIQYQTASANIKLGDKINKVNLWNNIFNWQKIWG